MNISTKTQAVLLLTARFSKAENRDPRPLTPTEWGRFASWLKEQGLRPEDLITKLPKEVLEQWRDERINLERIERLLERGSALAIAMDKWIRAGIWVVTRSDRDYPGLLKKRLGVTSPALFFGSGNRTLLNKPGIAVIGSRNADDQDLDLSRRFGATAAAQGYSIVSGGARGVDEAAMLGALEVEGIAVGIVADSLLRKGGSPKFRKYLQNGDLSLISPFFPEAGFHVGNAMARNKYIYCISEAAVVVHSGSKGGTWAGAHEAIKKGWVPVWVKKTEDKAAGNSQIVNAGARWISGDIAELDVRSLREAGTVVSDGLDFSAQPRTVEDKVQEVRSDSTSEELGQSDDETAAGESVAAADDLATTGAVAEELLVPSPGLSLYELFLCKVEELCRGQARNAEEVAGELELDSAQVRSWVYRASRERRLKRLLKPLRFELPLSDDRKNPHPTSAPMPSFYELFLVKIEELCGGQESSAEEVVKVLQVLRPQLDRWVKRSVAEGELKRYRNPVRYEWVGGDPKQINMFRAETPK